MFGNGKLLATGLLLLSLCATGLAEDSFISFEAGSQGFCIAAQGNAAPIVAAAQEDVGVRRAARISWPIFTAPRASLRVFKPAWMPEFRTPFSLEPSEVAA